MSGRPLQDNLMDAALFVGRSSELDVLASALQQDLNVFVHGEPGIGRTSLLKTMMFRGRAAAGDRSAGESDFRYLRAEGAATGEQLLARIAEEILGAAYEPTGTGTSDATLRALRQYRQELTAGHRGRVRGQTAATPSAAGLATTPAAGPGVRVVLVLDDVAAGAGHELFGRFRDELWTMGYRWVVAARSSERALLAPPADAFFERMLPLGPLTEAEAVELIDRRQLWPTGWSAAVAKSIDGNPRRLLATARDFVDRRDLLDSANTAAAQRDEAIAQLGRPATMLAAELDALGAASASDEALLGRLGWTRARATQVFAQLDQAGLVQSTQYKSGPGRPKRVFRLTPPEEYLTGR
jgi:AAA ATPase domain